MRYLTPLPIALLLTLVAACGDGGLPSEESPAVLVGEPPLLASPTRTPDPTAAPTPSPTPAPTRQPQLVSLSWLGGGTAVPGLDSGITPPALDPGLQTAINGALAGFTGKASVVVHNLADGRYAATAESESYYAASTFKAAVLLEAYRQRDAGTLDFAKEVVVEEKYVMDDLGTLEYLEIAVNDRVTIADAVRGMIVVSDTPLANLMIDEVGSNNVDATIRSVGANTMTVNDRGLPTTALDMTQLMTAIAAGQGVTTASRDEMLSLLAREWFTEGVMAGVPSGTTVAHKSGNFGGATHDAAIVWGPDGPYAITVLTDGSGSWAPIAAVSSAVWQYFESTP